MISFELHREFLRMQRRMRRLRMQTPGSTPTKVSIILTLLAKQPDISPNELADFLRMDQGNLSRLLKQLAQEGLLRLSRSVKDARSKRLVFTDRGMSALADALRLNHHLAQVGMHPLSDIERSHVGRVFAMISTALGAKPVIQLEGEDLFVSEQMRLLRTLGMIGSSYLGTPWDIGTYQLLFVLSELHEQTFSELKAILPVEPTTLSREISRLCAENILRKELAPNSGKQIVLSLTKTGTKMFSKVHQAATKRLALAMSEIPSSELSELKRLLALAGTTTAPDYQYKICRTKEDFFRARAILIEKLVSRRNHFRIPSHFLPDDSKCVVIERDGEPVGLVAAKARKVLFSELPAFLSRQEQDDCLSQLQSFLGFRLQCR